jgi:hypothetical protein
VAVPNGWRRSRDSTGGLVFSAPKGGTTLRIGTWTSPPRNVVAGLIAEEHDVRLTWYRRIRIEALPVPPDAVWEYTFQDPHGVPMRGLQRVLTAGAHTYVVEWRAPSTAWAAELQRLSTVQNSFEAAPGD